MGLFSWLFGAPEDPIHRARRVKKHGMTAEDRERARRVKAETAERLRQAKAEIRAEKAEAKRRAGEEHERRIWEQMDRSYAAGHLVNPRLTAAERAALPDDAFAAPDERQLPLEDAAHVRNAVSRFGRTQFRNVAEARAAAAAILKAAVEHDVPIGRGTILAEFTGVYAERVNGNPGLFDLRPEFGGTRLTPMKKGRPVSSGGVEDFWRPQYERYKPGERPRTEAARMRQDRSSRDMFEENPDGAGFLDGMGRFHPIRNSPSYSPILSGEDQVLSGYWAHPDKRVRVLSDSIAAEEMRLAGGRVRRQAALRDKIRGQRRRLVDLLKRYDKREREERERYEAQQKAVEKAWSAQSQREWKRELRQAIRAVSPSGIAPHEKRRGGSALETEYRLDVPINLRNRRGLPPDEVAQLLAYEYPHLGIESEDDLLRALA